MPVLFINRLLASICIFFFIKCSDFRRQKIQLARRLIANLPRFSRNVLDVLFAFSCQLCKTEYKPHINVYSDNVGCLHDCSCSNCSSLKCRF